jgi:hypothetical protein
VGILLAGALTGCGGGQATVSGRVTWEGNELERGYVTFYPADGRGVALGAEVAGGRYRVAGLVPGKKRVRVVAQPRPERTADARKVKLLPPADPIPDNAAGNNDVVEVAGGARTLDLALRKRPQAGGTRPR